MDFYKLENQFMKKKVNAFLVYQQGELTTKYYKTKECAHNLYKINSITKSIVSILIGIAIDKGYINDIHTPIAKWFPNVPKEKKELTIYHLLTMTTGEEWKEFGNGVVFPNDFVESDNWINYILQKPLMEEIGAKMNYNSGSSHLLSYKLQVATGKTTEQFAKKYLFNPLQITEYEWQQDPQGIYVGGFGMKMKADDLLKIGLLCLQNGFWNGERIVSSSWIEQSSKVRFMTYEHVGAYGYHWWVLDNERFHIPYCMYFAMGYGGQYIIIIPRLELVAIISSQMPKRGLVPLKLFINHLQENVNHT
ncbi:6-aminohexanoate hydrolase [Bacillus pseudomycoides]|uniref:serine hydrolase domain-containing protein n=1 Tax=Bacillus pseudomycoides TaxID=64104 RepID=UPI000BEBB873|nr:serine hydrolase [Bacillus pseudomycoides]PEF74331.1 6-aminohexanoate hydrolase [Bacillus pseudomycoides]PEL90499.1 6-aminohexanoate hydrolase [Bacillus pseudomycoides]